MSQKWPMIDFFGTDHDDQLIDAALMECLEDVGEQGVANDFGHPLRLGVGQRAKSCAFTSCRDNAVHMSSNCRQEKRTSAHFSGQAASREVDLLPVRGLGRAAHTPRGWHGATQ